MPKAITGAEARRRMLAFREARLRQQAERATTTPSAMRTNSPPSPEPPPTKDEAAARLREERRQRGRAQWEAKRAEREETKKLANDMLADRTVPLFVEDRAGLLDEAKRVREATLDVAMGMASVLQGCVSPWTGRAIAFSERGQRERARPR